MICKIKLLREGAKPPAKAHPTSTGFDVYAVDDGEVWPGETAKVPSGFACELDPGYGLHVRPRSSQWIRRIDVQGTIDNEWRGEVCLLIANHDSGPYTWEAGDRIAQIVVERVYDCEMVVVDELAETARGGNGFGSTGR